MGESSHLLGGPEPMSIIFSVNTIENTLDEVRFSQENLRLAYRFNIPSFHP